MNPRAFAIAAVASLAAAAPLAALADVDNSSPYDIDAMPSYNATVDRGTVEGVSGNSFTLTDGTTVKVGNFTAMTSPVSELAPGMTVAVVGQSEGSSAIKATSVRVTSGFNPWLDLGGN
jgi:hypothetical protein